MNPQFLEHQLVGGAVPNVSPMENPKIITSKREAMITYKKYPDQVSG